MKGTVFVFSTILIFKATGRTFPIFGLKNTDIVVPLKNLEKVCARDSAVSVKLCPQDESGSAPKSNVWSFLCRHFNTGKFKTLPEKIDVEFILDDNESWPYFYKILKEKIDDSKGIKGGYAQSAQRFKPNMMMPYTKDSKVQSNMDPEEASTLNKLSAQAQVMRFKPGEIILHVGATERRLFCIWKGVVACKTSDGKVDICRTYFVDLLVLRHE